jgi:hypothetical protein
VNLEPSHEQTLCIDTWHIRGVLTDLSSAVHTGIAPDEAEIAFHGERQLMISCLWIQDFIGTLYTSTAKTISVAFSPHAKYNDGEIGTNEGKKYGLGI